MISRCLYHVSESYLRRLFDAGHPYAVIEEQDKPQEMEKPEQIPEQKSEDAPVPEKNAALSAPTLAEPTKAALPTDFHPEVSSDDRIGYTSARTKTGSR